MHYTELIITSVWCTLVIIITEIICKRHPRIKNEYPLYAYTALMIGLFIVGILYLFDVLFNIGGIIK